jgi:hypothetical protein
MPIVWVSLTVETQPVAISASIASTGKNIVFMLLTRQSKLPRASSLIRVGPARQVREEMPV